MEALYAKLYNKYTKLKKEKESKVEQLNREQEVKFLNFAAAADEMIQYLKSENDRLRGQIDELKSELACIRSSKDEQDIQYQKLLMEENLKNKELSEEIAKLKNLQTDGPCHSRNKKFETEQTNGHPGSLLERGASSFSALKSKRKRKRVSPVEDITMPHEHDRATDECSDRNEVVGAILNIQQPACCRRKVDTSGDDVNCMFQVLVELVVGMKISFVVQKDELCISALHQSSGYSFSLTWISNSGGDTEFVYRVLSLGTFERVAPEWMRETLMFSTSMCPIFFDRVSRVIKG